MGGMMSTLEVASVAVGVVASIVAIWLGVAAYRRNHHQDDMEGGKRSGTILTEIGYIKANTDDIKRRQEKQDERHVELITRVTAVEQSAKQAHHRIDRLEGRADKEDI